MALIPAYSAVFLPQIRCCPSKRCTVVMLQFSTFIASYLTGCLCQLGYSFVSWSYVFFFMASLWQLCNASKSFRPCLGSNCCLRSMLLLRLHCFGWFTQHCCVRVLLSLLWSLGFAWVDDKRWLWMSSLWTSLLKCASTKHTLWLLLCVCAFDWDWWCQHCILYQWQHGCCWIYVP